MGPYQTIVEVGAECGKEVRMVKLIFGPRSQVTGLGEMVVVV